MGRQGLFECTSISMSLVKWSVILTNIIIWLLGIASLALGVWLYVTNNEYAVLSQSRYLPGSVLLMAAGFGVIIIGFIGAIGAIFESVFVLVMFMVLIGITSIIQVATGGWAVQTSIFTEGSATLDLERSRELYEDHINIQEAYDHLHTRFMCCSGTVSEWQMLIGRVPDTCCVSFADNCGRNTGVNPIRNEPCNGTLSEYVRQQLYIIGPFGLTAGLFGIIVAWIIPGALIFLICTKKESYDLS